LQLILKGDPLLRGLLQFNAFTGRIMLLKPIPVTDREIPKAQGPYPRPWDDDADTRLLVFVQREWAPSFKRATVAECIAAEARDNAVHPLRDWLDQLGWDGTPRLAKWLTMVFGCDLSPYHGAVGSKLLIAAVRRVRQPGCKFDFMLVLEGRQGIGKSRALAVLFGEEFVTDDIGNLAHKDAAIALNGKWCVEFSEIEQLIKADIETVKAFLSRNVDHYRPPYGRTAVDVPRQCVLVGTTNTDAYLRDTTGNRRIWPVRCRSEEAADLDWLRQNREQLWAEAAQMELRGASIWLDDAAVRAAATEAQCERLTGDPWTDRVRQFACGKPELRTPDVLKNALEMPVKDHSRAAEMRVAAILQADGWTRTTKRCAGKPTKLWLAPEENEGDLL
jgi:predicted P-loop ATPase